MEKIELKFRYSKTTKNKIVYFNDKHVIALYIPRHLILEKPDSIIVEIREDK